MTTMLDLLTRLADALETQERSLSLLRPFTPSPLLTEARRAIKETRVIEVEGCQVWGHTTKWISLHGSPLLNMSDETENYSENSALSDFERETPCTVTILVRVGGGS